MLVPGGRKKCRDDFNVGTALFQLGDDRLRLLELAHRRRVEPDPLAPRLEMRHLFLKTVEQPLAPPDTACGFLVKKAEEMEGEPGKRDRNIPVDDRPEHAGSAGGLGLSLAGEQGSCREIGRASCRARVEISVVALS